MTLSLSAIFLASSRWREPKLSGKGGLSNPSGDGSVKNNRAIFLISKVEGRNVSYLAWIATPRPTITTDSPRIEADWQWRPIWNLVDIPEITFHRCRCGNGDAGRDRLDFGSRPCGISQGSRHARRVAPLSLSLFREKRKEGEEQLVFDNGADLSFRSVRYRHRWKFFKKRRKEIQGVG